MFDVCDIIISLELNAAIAGLVEPFKGQNVRDNYYGAAM